MAKHQPGDEAVKSQRIWEEIADDLEIARAVLDLEEETREQSLAPDANKTNRLRYRLDENSRELLTLHLRSGRRTLERIDRKISNGNYGNGDELIVLFGRLFLDVGFLLAYVELPSADIVAPLQARRAAEQKRLDRERIWIARQIVPRMKHKRDRTRVGGIVAKKIAARCRHKELNEEERRWLRSLLVGRDEGRGIEIENPRLKKTYAELKHEELHALAAQKGDNLYPDLPGEKIQLPGSAQ